MRQCTGPSRAQYRDRRLIYDPPTRRRDLDSAPALIPKIQINAIVDGGHPQRRGLHRFACGSHCLTPGKRIFNRVLAERAGPRFPGYLDREFAPGLDEQPIAKALGAHTMMFDVTVDGDAHISEAVRAPPECPAVSHA